MQPTVTAKDIFETIGIDTDGKVADGTYGRIEELFDRARQEARHEALKEMDEAHMFVKDAMEAERFPYITSKAKESLDALRQEYSNQP